MVYLISEEQADRIAAAGIPVELTDSANPAYAPGSWVTQEALQLACSLIPDLKTLAEVDDLPVFNGPLETPGRTHYASGLTALCLARRDGQSIRGLSYLPPYDEYWFSRDLGRCFCYGRPGDAPHFWRVIGHAGDLDWLRSYWGDAYGFEAWLTLLAPGNGWIYA